MVRCIERLYERISLKFIQNGCLFFVFHDSISGIRY
jgi:hypothetical protein